MKNGIDDTIYRVAELLVAEGLSTAFGITGSGVSLSLITALEDLGVKYFPVAHEAAGAIMAGTVSKTSQKISASISIKGPGLANMLPGIAYNYFENNPAISISENFGLNVPPYKMHKRLNHASLTQSLVKAASDITNIDENIPKLCDFAFKEIPGPVHLDLSSGKNEQIYLSEEPDQATSNGSWNAIVQAIQSSHSPVLIVGSLGFRLNRSSKWDVLKIPVFTTAAAKGFINETNTWSCGVFTGDGKELAPENIIPPKSDLIIGLGLRNTEVLSAKSFGKKTILLDTITPGKLNILSNGFQAELIYGCLQHNELEELLETLSLKEWDASLIKQCLNSLRSSLINKNWLPAAIFDSLNHLSENHALILDTGSFCTIGEHIWMSAQQRPYLGSSNGRYMGTGLPTAIGFSISHPNLPTFAGIGDGGIRMYLPEIKLAVTEKLPLCIILMTDGYYGSIACAPQPRTMSKRAVKIEEPSWWRAIEHIGCNAILVQSIEAFNNALQQWDHQQPIFIEASFEPETYATMAQNLR